MNPLDDIFGSEGRADVVEAGCGVGGGEGGRMRMQGHRETRWSSPEGHRRGFGAVGGGRRRGVEVEGTAGGGSGCRVEAGMLAVLSMELGLEVSVSCKRNPHSELYNVTSSGVY